MDQMASPILMDAAANNLYPALFQCFTIILCGYVAGRLNVVTPGESKGISTFVGTFALPSLIFLSLAKLDFSTVNWTFLLAILLAKGLVFFAVVLITIIVSKPVNLGCAGIFAIFCTQSNDFALGYPIISAIYEKTHPEYALYLYLMAPISLAILNPVAFVLMEIHKQSQSSASNIGDQRNICNRKLMIEILKGIAFNPILVMTVLGILGNIIFKHHLSIYIEGLLQVFGDSFSASALFLLGLRMVGQFHRLKGPSLLLPCVLIMVKLIILPIVLRESVTAFNAGMNETETQSLSTYAFLYGTIPTAPAVFVFTNLYQIEVDLVASSMVLCTFLSGPMMFLSSEVIGLNEDYQQQSRSFGFGLSIISLIAMLWVLIVFIVTKKYKRMPHRLTFCLLASQILLAITVILRGTWVAINPSWYQIILQAIRYFSMYSCLLWTSMLSVALVMLESRGPCFLLTVWPVLGFVAWGASAITVIVLVATTEYKSFINPMSASAIRLCLLVFCLTVTTGCLIVYIRFRRRNIQSATLSADVAASSTPNEGSSLIQNAEPGSQTTLLNDNYSSAEDPGCYGTITATPSPSKSGNGCCTNDANCTVNELNSTDIEDLGNVVNKDCACPPSQKHRCPMNGPCTYLMDLEHAAGQLGLLPPEQSRGRGGQLLKHTVLIIVYNLSMFLGVTYTVWKLTQRDESGIFIEIEFLDIAANYGQGLVIFILFGLDPNEILIPIVRSFTRRWHGADIVLPPIDDLNFETKHVCDQFITHHLERCKDAIAKDTRWRMRVYNDVFRGSCLVRWLIECGLAKDEHEAVHYGRLLLDGRLIAHVNNTHHFTNSPLLYVFK